MKNVPIKGLSQAKRKAKKEKDRKERAEADFATERNQKHCHHRFEPVMRFDRNYKATIEGEAGDTILKSFRCKDCGKTKPRPIGRPWDVCYKCGGDMVYDSHFLIGNAKCDLHKCPKCGHEYETA
ncbi:MAG: hypothetical protein WCF94_01555 [bacterium]